eukprot:90468-Rhodomonas_salina.2
MAPPDILGVRIGCFDQGLVSTSLRGHDVCSVLTQRVCAKSSSPARPPLDYSASAIRNSFRGVK